MARARVLILSASVGAGHVRAAEALEAAFRSGYPDVHAEHHDVLEFTNAVFRRIYAKTYLDLVARAPHLLGALYDWMDQPVASKWTSTDEVRKVFEQANLRRFERFVEDGKWDLILSTHFLSVTFIAHLRTVGKLGVPQATVCTDFFTHRLWVNQPCDLFTCATEEGAEYLRYWGVPGEKIAITGIPIDPIFADPPKRADCRLKYGLDPDRPVILQMCGGFGVGPIEEINRAFADIQRPLQIVTICGKNDKLRAQLESSGFPSRHRRTLVGFTREIHEWMAASDLIVSKPGGLTSSECLAMGLPMVIANPIPGQETRNSDYLLEHGAAVKINHPCHLARKVAELLDGPEQLARLQGNARKAGRPHAAFEVIERSMKLI